MGASLYVRERKQFGFQFSVVVAALVVVVVAFSSARRNNSDGLIPKAEAKATRFFMDGSRREFKALDTEDGSIPAFRARSFCLSPVRCISA